MANANANAHISHEVHVLPPSGQWYVDVIRGLLLLLALFCTELEPLLQSIWNQILCLSHAQVVSVGASPHLLCLCCLSAGAWYFNFAMSKSPPCKKQAMMNTTNLGDINPPTVLSHELEGGGDNMEQPSLEQAIPEQASPEQAGLGEINSPTSSVPATADNVEVFKVKLIDVCLFSFTNSPTHPIVSPSCRSPLTMRA